MRARLIVAALLLFSTLGTSSFAVPLANAAGAPVPAAGNPSLMAVEAAAKTPAETKASVKAAWMKFFSAKTPPAKKIKLLQDGKQFASLIRAASKNPLASAVSAKVAKVALVSKTKAHVIYSVVAAGQTVLKNQKGTAVFEGGTWKVDATSFCGLLTLENGGKKGLPKACG